MRTRFRVAVVAATLAAVSLTACANTAPGEPDPKLRTPAEHADHRHGHTTATAPMLERTETRAPAPTGPEPHRATPTGDYVDQLRTATGEHVTVAQADQFASTICGLFASIADGGEPDPAGRIATDLDNSTGPAPGGTRNVVDLALRYGCPQNL